MNIIQSITDQPNQQIVLTLSDGSAVTWTLYYREQQAGWFYDVAWNGVNPSWQRLGQRLVTNPNLLRQNRNVIPFGIAVTTSNGFDPTTQDAFSSGYATAFLMTSADVAAIESKYFPGLS
jgi:hypothetical protein